MILLIPLSALIITQLIKTAIDQIRYPEKKFLWKDLNSYGGMPSAHSAMFSALIVTAFVMYGWNTFEFGIAVILYFVVVRDAIGIRWHLGEHGSILKQLIHEHVEDDEHIKHSKIVVRLGHKPSEALVGTIVGAIIALIALLLVGAL